ncbi:MAG: peptide MFS transporter [Deltaproteobacteria bacterium]|nr:peptide MFS transporter [Deltaproteobacteria bacterium]
MKFFRDSHPKGLYVLFMTEMWERFSFYGMRALLVLYMTKQLIYSDSKAYGVYGAYTAMVYALPILGGLLADRLLGYRRAITLGAILLAIGHFLMAFPSQMFFYIALALICCGVGFLKPNISSIVGKLYPQGDPRRDSGFTIFYMGINVGAFLSPLACGIIGENYGWHYGFALAGIGMLLGLIVFLRGQKHLQGIGEPPAPEKITAPFLGKLTRVHTLYAACVIAVPILAIALVYNQIISASLYVTTIATVLFLIYVAVTTEKVGRERLLSVIILMIFHTMFWAFFEQAGSSLTLFADRNVGDFFGWRVPASVTQSINPLFIIFLSPFFAQMWIDLSRRRKQPSIPTKFVLGIAQVGLGFGALVIGAAFAKDTGMTAFIWLVLAYLLHTTGEICISPVGLSAVTKLAPVHAVGTVMGAWFLSISFGQHVAALFAKLTQVSGEIEGMETVSAVQSLPIYTHVFETITWLALAIAAFLFIIRPFLKKLMHGVE